MLLLIVVGVVASCRDQESDAIAAGPTKAPAAPDAAPDAAEANGETGTLHLDVEPGPALVFLDTRFVAATTPGHAVAIEARPGAHDLMVQRAGYHDHLSRLIFRAGDERSATVHLVPLRLHRPDDPTLEARLALGGTVRGSLTIQDRRAREVHRSLGLDGIQTTAHCRADVIEVEPLPAGRTVRLFVNASGSPTNVHVIDEKGDVVADGTGKDWTKEMIFMPKAEKRYRVVIEHLEDDKLAQMDLVRYTAILER